MNALVAAKLRELDSPAQKVSFLRLAELVERLELKEGYAGDHTAAVSRLALAIAGKLGLDPTERRHVELGALLHDIGKLTVPDRVLTKPGPLNDLEWTAVQRHTAVGERLLIHIVDIPDVLAIVRSHHERWAGGGYPDGLTGEEIPRGARIVAVADAYQAMIEARPYRQPLARTSALAEILSHCGKQFDPACVAALQAVV